MFGRSKQTTSSPADEAPTGPGKNKPTPKRREVEAARRQPLVPAAGKGGGKAGKGASKAAREAARQERMRARQLMLAGDERYLLQRDKGPVRRYIRDVVDARWSVGELLLPVMLVILLVNFVGSGALGSRFLAVNASIFAFTYAMVLLSAIDSYLMVRRLKKNVRAKFGADAWVRGSAMYAVMRAYQIRRTRVPKPMVKRGAHPA